VVVKRSGERVPFDRSKVIGGLVAATKGRPVATEQLDELANSVEDAIRLQGPEVSSSDVGRTVLEHLRELDVVAAVRFASVYKDFSDLADFERELTELTSSGLIKATEPKRA
jgi:transcriptional repressor NrdR